MPAEQVHAVLQAPARDLLFHPCLPASVTDDRPVNVALSAQPLGCCEDSLEILSGADVAREHDPESIGQKLLLGRWLRPGLDWAVQLLRTVREIAYLPSLNAQGLDARNECPRLNEDAVAVAIDESHQPFDHFQHPL